MKKTVLAAMVAFGAMISAVPAAAVPFTVTGGSFILGNGYGAGANHLDVVFTSLVSSNAASALNFNLSPGQTQSFLFGRATLNETCINGGNVAIDTANGCGTEGNETNGLGVTAMLNFSSPLLVSVMDVAVTGAFVGPVNGDNPALSDFFVDFAPVTVNFGDGGSFIVDIGDLFFNSTGSITNGANVTLLASPIPEPGMIMLFALGTAGLVISRRNRRA